MRLNDAHLPSVCKNYRGRYPLPNSDVLHLPSHLFSKVDDFRPFGVPGISTFDFTELIPGSATCPISLEKLIYARLAEAIKMALSV